MQIQMAKALYFSGAGTTKLVAERFADACGAPAESHDVTPAGAAVPSFASNDLVVFAVPSYGGRVPAPMSERIARCSGDSTPAALLVTYGNRAVDDTFAELADMVTARGFVPVAACAVVAHHSLMTNVAEGRPDENDLAAVDAFARGVMAKLSRAETARDAELEKIPGNRPYCDFSGVPFHPEADTSACTGCGTCATQCPVRAIDPSHPEQTDAEACISCMRCVAACPVEARKIGGGLALAAARKAFALKCARRQDTYSLL